MLRWPIDVYRDEHRRIVEHLDKAEQRLARERRGDARSRTIIAMLDEERPLKHLLEHHREREERGLFCEIRAELPVEARAALMSDVMACAHH